MAAFDLFTFFVAEVFGNFLFAIIGLLGLMALIFIFTRTNVFTSCIILGLFFMTLMAGFYGSVIAVFLFFLSLSYFMYNLVGWVTGT